MSSRPWYHLLLHTNICSFWKQKFNLLMANGGHVIKLTSTSSTSDDVVHLYIWGGEWGLPSIDTESLQALVS